MELGIKLIAILSLCLDFLHLPECSRTEDCSLQKYGAMGFIQIKEIGKCLLFSSTKRGWYAAYKSCMTFDARLYTAYHVEELLQESYIPYRFRREDYWIGLNDIAREGEFRWNLALPPSTSVHWGRRDADFHGVAWSNFIPWGKGQPDNLGGQKGQDCVVKSKSGLWEDESCAKEIRYICEAVSDPQDARRMSHAKESHGWLITMIVLTLLMAIIPGAWQVYSRTRLEKMEVSTAAELEEETDGTKTATAFSESTSHSSTGTSDITGLSRLASITLESATYTATQEGTNTSSSFKIHEIPTSGSSMQEDTISLSSPKTPRTLSDVPTDSIL